MLSLLKLMWMESGRQHMLHYIMSLNISLIALTYFCELQIILLLIKHAWFLYVVVHATWYNCKSPRGDETSWFIYPNVSRQHLQLSSILWPHAQNEEQSSLIFCNFYAVIYFLTLPSLLNRDNKTLIEVQKAADRLWLGHVVFRFHYKFLRDIMGNKASV